MDRKNKRNKTDGKDREEENKDKKKDVIIKEKMMKERKSKRE